MKPPFIGEEIKGFKTKGSLFDRIHSFAHGDDAVPRIHWLGCSRVN